MKHVILDYDVGNLDSVLNGFLKVGMEAIISKDPAVIKAYLGERYVEEHRDMKQDRNE